MQPPACFPPADLPSSHFVSLGACRWRFEGTGNNHYYLDEIELVTEGRQLGSPEEALGGPGGGEDGYLVTAAQEQISRDAVLSISKIPESVREARGARPDL